MKFNNCEVIKNFAVFCEKSNIIIANRWNKGLNKYKEKIYTRDVYGEEQNFLYFDFYVNYLQVVLESNYELYKVNYLYIIL